MRLVSFLADGRVTTGLVVGEEIVDLVAAGLPAAMDELLAGGEQALAAVRRAGASKAPRFPRANVALLAPLPRPPAVLAIGLNYKDHIAETGREQPSVPVVFNKQRTAVIGPGAPILVPPDSEQVDYEGELAFVIGRRCRRVPRSRAAEVIAGYTICNDVSVRDWQRRTPTMTMGKGWDSHCPLGPELVTADELGDPHALELSTRVDGELRQHSNTRELLFDCFALVEFLSTAFTLEPGLVVTTGTPGGVAAASNPAPWLRPGQTVEVSIEGIGTLANPVAAEAPPATH
jgi:2-keto-4-pentenoate hydratase/2-oxohepta-3-ene-1,7-dioic acid hydratase in catechol pathway